LSDRFILRSGKLTQGCLIEHGQTPTGSSAMTTALKLSGLGLAAVIASTAAMTGTASAEGPAFNCRYAKLAVEIAICDSSYLSSLDRRMSRTYYRVMNSQWVKYEDPALGRRIKRTHRRWIARRNACGYNEGCIARRYENYIPELRAHLHYGTD
jgi:uncharacterized protein